MAQEKIKFTSWLSRVNHSESCFPWVFFSRSLELQNWDYYCRNFNQECTGSGHPSVQREQRLQRPTRLRHPPWHGVPPLPWWVSLLGCCHRSDRLLCLITKLIPLLKSTVLHSPLTPRDLDFFTQAPLNLGPNIACCNISLSNFIVLPLYHHILFTARNLSPRPTGGWSREGVLAAMPGDGPCGAAAAPAVHERRAPGLSLPRLPNPSRRPWHPWPRLHVRLTPSRSRAVTSHTGATELDLFPIYLLMQYHQKRLVKGFGLVYA